jgi:ParB family chromosome partitioning protein
MIEPCKMQNQPLFLPRFPSKKPIVPHQPPKNSDYLSGELFVDSLLIRHGLTVLPVPESMPFDRLICIDDRHLKIQIKTTTRSRNGYYLFNLQKGHYRSRRGVQRYASDEVEPMTDEEAATYDALKTEFEKLEADHADADELPNEVDARLGEIETAMETLQDRLVRFEEDELAIAGAFVSIDSSGRLRVERGYVRPEEEPALPSEDQPDADTANGDVDGGNIDNDAVAHGDEDDEDDGIKPLSDRLVTELTAHRTLALRNALANALAGDPHIAFVAALNVLTLKLFYRYGSNSCIEIDPRSAAFSAQAPGLADTASAQAIKARSENWRHTCPNRPKTFGRC